MPNRLSHAINAFFALTVLVQFAPAQTKETFVARVLNVAPVIVEFLPPPEMVISSSDTRFTAIQEITETKAADFQGIRFGDIVTGSVCTRRLEQQCDGESRNVVGNRCGGPELCLDISSELREIKKLNRSDSEKYRDKGLLLAYSPGKGRPFWQPQMLINRDGSVLLHHSYAGEIKYQRLSRSELNGLTRAYKSTGFDQSPDNFLTGLFGIGIVSAISEYRFISTEHPSRRVEEFIKRLDALTDRYLRQATYHISHPRRTPIKDWQYGNLFPLDQYDLNAPDKTGINLLNNVARLSQIKPPPEFFEEAIYRSGKFDSFFYRYKNEIYVFEFATCTIHPTGTWACSQTWKLRRGDTIDYPNSNYDIWPGNLAIKPEDIPTEGMDIPSAEFFKHREFYSAFLSGQRIGYQNGDYIYNGLQVTYH